MRRFDVHGPFQVEYDEKTARYDVDETAPGVSQAYAEIKQKYGCYVFATRWGDNFRPWYVGKTTRTFAEEIFEPHKIGKLDQISDYLTNYSLWVLLVAPRTGRGRKSWSATDEIETYLIHAAAAVNPDLLNLRKLPKKAWQIVGVTKREKGNRPAAVTLRNMLHPGS
jgi:hypothetical protein